MLKRSPEDEVEALEELVQRAVAERNETALIGSLEKLEDLSRQRFIWDKVIYIFLCFRN
jgi:hypothetical protein